MTITVYPWQGKVTSSGHKTIGPQHKLPHPAKPFKCTLYNLLKTEKDGDKRSILRQLKIAFEIMNGQEFKPLFKKAEIDDLFTAELKTYANGTYKTPQDFSTPEHCMDYLNNRGVTNASTHRFLLKEGKGEDSAEERLDLVKGLQTGLRALKLAEDWLFYHPTERAQLSEMIDAYLAT